MMNLKNPPQVKELIQITGVAALYYAFIGKENYPGQVNALAEDALGYWLIDIHNKSIFNPSKIRIEC